MLFFPLRVCSPLMEYRFPLKRSSSCALRQRENCFLELPRILSREAESFYYVNVLLALARRESTTKSELQRGFVSVTVLRVKGPIN